MKHTHEEYVAFVNERIARKQAQIKDVERYEGGSLADLIYDEQPLSKWGVELKELEEDIASLLANRAVLERHKERPFNWMTDQAIGMFSEAFPEPPQLPRCVTCRYENFPCPTYTDIAAPIRSVM